MKQEAGQMGASPTLHSASEQSITFRLPPLPTSPSLSFSFLRPLHLHYFTPPVTLYLFSPPPYLLPASPHLPPVHDVRHLIWFLLFSTPAISSCFRCAELIGLENSSVIMRTLAAEFLFLCATNLLLSHLGNVPDVTEVGLLTFSEFGGKQTQSQTL